MLNSKEKIREVSSKILNKIGVYAVLFLLLATFAPLTKADDFESLNRSDQIQDQTQIQSVRPEISGVQTQIVDTQSPLSGSQSQSIIDQPLTPAQEQEAFLKRLNDELKISKSEYYEITRNIAETRNRLNSLKTEVGDLQKQLAYFDDQIDQIAEKLFIVIRQVVRTENEIKIIYEEIEIKQVALNYQKELLKDYIQNLYVYSDTYLDIGKDGNLDAFKLLLSDGDAGDVIKEIKYLGILEETGTRLVDRLGELNKDLLDRRAKLETKKTYLQDLQRELAFDKQNLDSQKAAKENLLSLTRNQDQIYRALLEQSIEQQQESLLEVQAFKNALDFIQKKIAEDGEDFDINKYKDFVGEKFMTLYEFQKLPASSEGFIWPVMPSNGLSAYFHDPSYAAHFGVQHNAIDIRTPQGTPIMAAADGVVYKAKDNDYGYSYIMLVHHNGFMTTYGHVSQIIVKEGEVVTGGSVIGLSGGMPGTKGAGYMTTGPHLHLEVMRDGAYVDPLRFLSLEVLSKDMISNLPPEYLDDWDRAIMNSNLLKE